MAAAAAKFRMEVDGMYKEEGISLPVRPVNDSGALESERVSFRISPSTL